MGAAAPLFTAALAPAHGAVLLTVPPAPAETVDRIVVLER